MKEEVDLRIPDAVDGMAVHDLIARCAPLDCNSSYCNLLQVSHFANTALAAFIEQKLVGFVSGYKVPDREDSTWFVWQVAVDESARGIGLAKRMLLSVLARPHMADTQYIETTITEENQASWALFKSLARQLDAPVSDTVLFDQQHHFQGHHASEYLVRIGPISL